MNIKSSSPEESVGLFYPKLSSSDLAYHVSMRLTVVADALVKRSLSIRVPRDYVIKSVPSKKLKGITVCDDIV